jgi:molecular chaperone GrpE
MRNCVRTMSKRHKEDETNKAAAPDAVGNPTAPDAIDGPRTDELKDKLAAAESEIAELKDKYLRALAEAENSRKRMRHQNEETVRFQRESLLRDLLPIVDNLERAVDAARGGGNGQPIVEGVEMVLHAMREYLRAQGVTPLSAVGQAFDPTRHEAIDAVPSDEHPPNTVVDEVHRGYQIGERILRPARVTVSLPAPARQRSDGEDGSSDIENQ